MKQTLVSGLPLQRKLKLSLRGTQANNRRLAYVDRVQKALSNSKRNRVDHILSKLTCETLVKKIAQHDILCHRQIQNPFGPLHYDLADSRIMTFRSVDSDRRRKSP